MALGKSQNNIQSQWVCFDYIPSSSTPQPSLMSLDPNPPLSLNHSLKKKKKMSSQITHISITDRNYGNRDPFPTIRLIALIAIEINLLTLPLDI